MTTVRAPASWFGAYRQTANTSDAPIGAINTRGRVWSKHTTKQTKKKCYVKEFWKLCSGVSEQSRLLR